MNLAELSPVDSIGCREAELNCHRPAYEAGVLPLNYPALVHRQRLERWTYRLKAGHSTIELAMRRAVLRSPPNLAPKPYGAVRCIVSGLAIVYLRLASARPMMFTGLTTSCSAWRCYHWIYLRPPPQLLRLLCVIDITAFLGWGIRRFTVLKKHRFLDAFICPSTYNTKKAHFLKWFWLLFLKNESNYLRLFLFSPFLH